MMTKDEFVALPAALALGIVWDALVEQRSMTDIEAPKATRPPKYDSVIYRREGITFASEYDAEGLRFWQRRAAESASSGGQYAEKDAKQAKALGYWVEWRSQNPDARWTGERNHEQVTAAAPLSKPRIYEREEQRAPAPTKEFSDADYGGADDDLPF